MSYCVFWRCKCHSIPISHIQAEDEKGNRLRRTGENVSMFSQSLTHKKCWGARQRADTITKISILTCCSSHVLSSASLSKTLKTAKSQQSPIVLRNGSRLPSKSDHIWKYRPPSLKKESRYWIFWSDYGRLRFQDTKIWLSPFNSWE